MTHLSEADPWVRRPSSPRGLPRQERHTPEQRPVHVGRTALGVVLPGHPKELAAARQALV